MGVLKLSVSTARDAATLTSVFEAVTGKHALANRIVNFITAVMSGNELALSATVAPSIAISIQDNQVAATGSFTFSNFSTANDTILVNGVTFTAVASGATGNQFNVATTASGQAVNLATTLNGSVSGLVSGYISASGGQVGSNGVCNITSIFYGLAGNQCTIAKGTDAGSVVTVSGARLTTGAEDPTAQTISF